MKGGAAATGQAKSRQGDDLLKEGDKCARTSLFKWTPDWEGAFMAYEKAALCFKAAKDQDKCKHAHLKAADAQYKCNLVHGAAKNYEAAGHCAREQKNWEEAVDYFRKASSLYTENGTLEKAAEVLTQAARGLEDSNADAAADLLLEAVDLLEQDSKRGAGDAFKRATALLIRNQRIERAIGVVGKEIEFLQSNSEGGKGLHELHRSHLALVILHLHQNDYVAADKAYNQALSCEGFAPSNEGRAAAELLEAFENNAPDTLQACLSRQVFTFLDGPVLRLARGLHVNDSAASGSSSSSSMAPRQQGETTDLRAQLLARPAAPASVPPSQQENTAAAAKGDDHREDEDEEENEDEEDEKSILL